MSAGSPSGEPNTPVVAEENLIVVSAPTPLTEDQSASQATPVVVENKKRTVSVEALCPVRKCFLPEMSAWRGSYSVCSCMH